MIGRPIKFLTAALCASTVILTGCAADRLHHEGMKSVEHGNYEDGVARLQKAVEKEPDNLTFRLDLRARSEEAVQKLIAEADAARAAGKREEAAAAYRRVLAINPANDRALRGVEGVDADRRHTDAVAAAQKDVAAKDLDHAETMLRAVLAEDPGFGPAVSLQQRIDQIRGPVQATPKLRTKDNRPVTLQFRDASTKMVFEVLSRQTGVNFIFDKDVKADGKTTIFVQDVPIETAIDLVLGQNQLAREVLSSNMVMIYPNTPAKQKDYQDEIVKTFYLSDADPKQVQTLIKTIVNPKAMFVDDRTGTLVVRDTPEVIRMTEKLINSIDLPDAEVMLEVEVLEITHSNVLNLGIQYPAGASFDMTPQGGGKGLTLADFTKQGKSTINVSSIGATLNALKTAGLTNTLASPRIRSRNHEKAKILIGQRVPVITNSVTPTTSSAVVTGSVQYLEVGLTLEVEPTVHRDGDVAIKLQLEVSSILNQVTTPSGTVAYQIGTRNANTLLQLKDGETQILAGLIQDSDQHTANKIPGLGDMPLLGRLFGSHKTDREKSEIVLAVTPRIIRAQRRPSSETTEFWYGPESGARSAPLGGFTVEGLGGAASRAANYSAPAVPNPIMQAAMQPPVPIAAAPVVAPPVAGAAAPAAAASGDSAAPAAKHAAPAAAAPTLTWDGPTESKVGDEFDVTLQLDTGGALTQIRGQIRYDANALELVSAGSGSVLGAIEGHIETPRGVALIDASATADAPISGSGALLSMHFRALAARASTAVSARVAATGVQGGAGIPTAPPLNISIKP
ncbi:MAG: secretin N-terminal domain-containing protein [Pseudomonadota bacterium]